jgi:hypothetical protein
MVEHSSRHLAGAGSGSDRSGLWTLEGVSLIALGVLAAWAWRSGLTHIDQFAGWIYVFVGAVRLAGGAIHRGPGLAWMLLSAALAMGTGLALLQAVGGAYVVGTILALYFLGAAFCAFGLSGGAGVLLACRRWLTWVALGDFLFAAAAITAARNDRPDALIALVALNLWLEGLTLLILGHRWADIGLAEAFGTPRPAARRTGSRTYGRPWSRPWRS